MFRIYEEQATPFPEGFLGLGAELNVALFEAPMQDDSDDPSHTARLIIKAYIPAK
jgi:hypothetical protein